MTYNTSLRKIVQVTIITSAIAIISAPAKAAGYTLMDFNESGASGTAWPGWTYYTNETGYGDPGWRKNGAQNYEQPEGGWLPATHQEGSHGNDSDARIDTTMRAPSTSTGASLHVYDTGNANPPRNTASWWFRWNDRFGDIGLADNSTNRLSFYLYYKGLNPGLEAGGNDLHPYAYNVDIGTYTCWPGGGSSGEDCPTEANNRHYYHRLTINPGAWLNVQLDRHPDWQRNVNVPSIDPDGPTHPYYYSMPMFYIQTAGADDQNLYPNPIHWWVDEIRTWTQTQTENELSICNPWIGYWPSNGYWEVGFHDLSFGTLVPGNSNPYNAQSKFEIRWSTSPITNANWSSAQTIIPQYNRFGSTNSFRRLDIYNIVVWTRFTLPTGTETNNNKIYFAIKDTSAITDGDAHNAPNTNVRTIDYDIRPSTGSQLAAPMNLQIK